jgi:Ca2+/Na+ antiporter
MYNENEPYLTKPEARMAILAIVAIAVLVVGCTSATALVIQMELIEGGGWCRATSRFIAVAALNFTLTVTAVLVTWWLILSQLSIDNEVVVGFVFCCVTVYVAVVLSKSIHGATQELRSPQRELRFNPSPLDR